ncbi:hypothetical protein ACSDR0_11585 [Streptosporangium sp. G11]|uniref:hypothetical protein n=1 Tax=Streptosporangium sp. G11 TaxID=3436926 RepID=UPI003EBFB0D1
MSILSTAIALADTSELAHTATVMVGRCGSTGLVPASYRGVIAAAVTLGMTGPPRAVAWCNDIEFVNALVDLETELSIRLREANAMIRTLWGRLEEIPATEENADLIATICAALEILTPAASRIEYAMGRLMAAPNELGETYAAAYNLVRSGRRLPRNGRWITGDAPSQPA